MPSACTSKIGSVPSAERRRTPRASPRPAMTDWTAATERALPWPLAAGISARRHHSWWAMVASMGGFMNVLSMSSETWPCHGGRVDRRRRDHVRDPVVLARREADVEVGIERLGDLAVEELADRLAGDAPDDLADEVALGHGVVARPGAGLPPRRLGGEPAWCTGPSRPAPRRCRGSSQPERPAVWPMTWRTSTRSLPLAANSGQ